MIDFERGSDTLLVVLDRGGIAIVFLILVLLVGLASFWGYIVGSRRK